MGNYNYARFLPEALNGILNQSRPADEIIVVDDASSDGSADILADFARRHREITYLRHERNHGFLDTYEELFDRAKGDYIIPASSDDIVQPRLFECALNLLEAHPQAGMCSAQAWVINEAGRKIRRFATDFVADRPAFISPAKARKLLTRYGSWFLCGGVYRRSAYDRAGGWSRDLKGYADDYLCQVMALSSGVCFLPQPLVHWRQSADTYSTTLGRNEAASRAVMRAALEKMRGPHRDLFPEAYIRRWQGRWEYGLRMTLAAAAARGGAVAHALPWRRRALALTLFLRHRPADIPFQALKSISPWLCRKINLL